MSIFDNIDIQQGQQSPLQQNNLNNGSITPRHIVSQYMQQSTATIADKLINDINTYYQKDYVRYWAYKIITNNNFYNEEFLFLWGVACYTVEYDYVELVNANPNYNPNPMEIANDNYIHNLVDRYSAFIIRENEDILFRGVNQNTLDRNVLRKVAELDVQFRNDLNKFDYIDRHLKGDHSMLRSSDRLSAYEKYYVGRAKVTNNNHSHNGRASLNANPMGASIVSPMSTSDSKRGVYMSNDNNVFEQMQRHSNDLNRQLHERRRENTMARNERIISNNWEDPGDIKLPKAWNRGSSPTTPRVNNTVNDYQEVDIIPEQIKERIFTSPFVPKGETIQLDKRIKKGSETDANIIKMNDLCKKLANGVTNPDNISDALLDIYEQRLRYGLYPDFGDLPHGCELPYTYKATIIHGDTIADITPNSDKLPAVERLFNYLNDILSDVIDQSLEDQNKEIEILTPEDWESSPSQKRWIAYDPFTHDCTLERNDKGHVVQRIVKRKEEMKEEDHKFESYIKDSVKVGPTPTKEDISNLRELREHSDLDFEESKKLQESSKEKIVSPSLGGDIIVADDVKTLAVLNEHLSDGKDMFTSHGYRAYTFMDNIDQTKTIKFFSELNDVQEIHEELLALTDTEHLKLANVLDIIYTDTVNKILKDLELGYEIDSFAEDFDDILKVLEDEGSRDSFLLSVNKAVNKLISDPDKLDTSNFYSLTLVDNEKVVDYITKIYVAVTVTHVKQQSVTLNIKNAKDYELDQLSAKLLHDLAVRCFKHVNKNHHYLTTSDGRIFTITRSSLNNNVYIINDITMEVNKY